MENLSLTVYTSMLISRYDVVDCLVNCSNRGLCQYSGSNETFVCVCETSYTGRTCLVNIDPCSYLPCLNNATCHTTATYQVDSTTNKTRTLLGYYCQCVDFYSGSNCEQPIDYCQLTNETCSYNGVCFYVGNKTACVCFNSYTGDRCEMQTQPMIVKKVVRTTSTAIAIVALALVYGFMLAMDVAKYAGCRQRNTRVRPNVVLIHVAEAKPTNRLVFVVNNNSKNKNKNKN